MNSLIELLKVKCAAGIFFSLGSLCKSWSTQNYPFVFSYQNCSEQTIFFSAVIQIPENLLGINFSLKKITGYYKNSKPNGRMDQLFRSFRPNIIHRKGSGRTPINEPMSSIRCTITFAVVGPGSFIELKSCAGILRLVGSTNIA